MELFKKGIPLDAVPVHDESTGDVFGSLFDILVPEMSKQKDLQPSRGTKKKQKRRRGKVSSVKGPAAKRSPK